MEHLSLALASGVFGIIWNVVGGMISSWMPAGIRDIVNIGNKDLWSTFLNLAFIGFGASLVHKKIILRYNVTSILS